MKDLKEMFTAGELAKYQNISKQTLLYYDKIGLFKPSYIDEYNGYRYYSSKQLEYLDAILIMKKIGFSLEEIKNHMLTYNMQKSLVFFKEQLDVIDEKINELSLLRSRLARRCSEVESVYEKKAANPVVYLWNGGYILCTDVKKPYSMTNVSIATKLCYAQAFKEDVPVYLQCGDIIPYKHILEGRYTEAVTAFLTSEKDNTVENIRHLDKGLVVSAYHFGNYYSIGNTYDKILKYCEDNDIKIISDSYEFCINDYMTSGDENEFITKIMFYVEI